MGSITTRFPYPRAVSSETREVRPGLGAIGAARSDSPPGLDSEWVLCRDHGPGSRGADVMTYPRATGRYRLSGPQIRET